MKLHCHMWFNVKIHAFVLGGLQVFIMQEYKIGIKINREPCMDR